MFRSSHPGIARQPLVPQKWNPSPGNSGNRSLPLRTSRYLSNMRPKLNIPSSEMYSLNQVLMQVSTGRYELDT